jgi:hypothetical protein
VNTTQDLQRARIITAKEAAVRYGSTVDHITRLCREGTLKGFVLKRVWYVDELSLISLIEVREDERVKSAEALAAARRRQYRRRQVTGTQEFFTFAFFAVLILLVLRLPMTPAFSAAVKNRSAAAVSGAVDGSLFASAFSGLSVFFSDFLPAAGDTALTVIPFRPTMKAAQVPPQKIEPTVPAPVAVVAPSRAPSQVIVKETVIERTVTAAADVTREYVDRQLQALKNSLSSDVFTFTSAQYPSAPSISQSTANLAVTQRIDRLANVAISGGSITGAEISGGSITGTSFSNGSVSATELSVSGTSTLEGISAANLSLTGDASATNLSLSGNLTVAGAQTLSGALSVPYLLATSTNTASSIMYRLGVATSTPSATLSVQGDSYLSGPAFFGGAITATSTLTVSGNTALANATSTNFFSTTASSTNLFSQNAAFGTLTAQALSVSGNTTQTGLATFAGGFLSQASSTVTGGLFTANGGASTTVLSVNGSAYFATAGGSVGIGTTSPAATLSIAGNNYITGGLGVGVLNTNAATALVSDGTNSILLHGGGAQEMLRTVGDSAFIDFKNNSAEDYDFREQLNADSSFFGFHSSSTANILILKQDGNIGIGTTTPQSALAVNGVIRADNNFGAFAAVQANGSGFRWSLNNNNTFLLQHTSNNFTSATVPLTVDSSDNIGIGTTTPNAALDVTTGGIATSPGTIPTGTWAARIFNQADTATSNGLLVMNRWAGPASTAFQVGSMYSGITQPFFRIDGVGNIGIGTTTPDSAVSVLNSTAGTRMLRLSTGSKYLDFGADYANNIPTIGTPLSGSQPLGFMTNGSERMRIDASGNVGVGTTSPAYKLDVTGADGLGVFTAAGASQRVRFVPEASRFTIETTNASQAAYSPLRFNGSTLTLAAGGTDYVTLTAGGALGIGTTTPNGKLNVYGSASGAQDAGVLDVSVNGGGSGDSGLSIGYDTTNNWSWLYSRTTGINVRPIALFAHSASVPTLLLNNNGNVGIGTTTPNNTLAVQGGITMNNTTDNSFTLNHYGTNGNNWSISNIAGAGNAGGLRFYNGNNAAEYMRITNAGNVGVGTTTPGAKFAVSGGNIMVENAQGLISGAGATFKTGPGGNTWNIQAGPNASTNFILFANDYQGTTKFAIDNTGNVGVGASAPVAKLEVVTGSDTSNGQPGAYTSNFFTVGAGGANGGSVFTSYNQSTNVGFIGTLKPGVAWGNMVLNPGGNVGVGAISDPYAKFQTRVGTDQNLAVRSNGDTELYAANDTNSAYVPLRLNASALYLNAQSGGNVGIGTTSPTEKLSVLSGDNTFGTNIFAVRANNLSVGVGIGYNSIRAVGTNGNNSLYIDSQNSAGTINLQSQSGGNVGIGTAGPSEKLEVSGSVLLANNTNLRFKNSSGASVSVLGVDNTNTTRLTSGGATLHINPDQTAINTYINYNNGGSVLIGDGTTASSFTVNKGTLSVTPASNGVDSLVVYNTARTKFVTVKPETATDQASIGYWTGSAFGKLDLPASETHLYGNGAEVLRVASNGNVGIGSTAPAAKLSIANGADDPLNYGKALQITNASGNSQQIAFVRNGFNVVSAGYNGASAIWGFGGGTTNDASFVPNILSLDAATGNVGVGTYAQHARFDVSDNGGSDGVVIRQPSDNQMAIQMYIDGHYSDRTTYGGGCCNDLYIQPDVGNVHLGPNFLVDHIGDFNTTGSVNGGVTGVIRNSNTGSDAYSLFSVRNDSDNGAHLFVNSSTRSADGGANTATLRNDIGTLRLQSSGAGGLTIAATSGDVTASSNLTVTSQIIPSLTSNSGGNTWYYGSNAWAGTIGGGSSVGGLLASGGSGSQLYTLASGPGQFSMQMDGSLFIGDGISAGNHGLSAASGGYLNVQQDAYLDSNAIVGNKLYAGGYYPTGAGSLNAFSLEIGGSAPDATNGQATLFLHDHGDIAHQLRYTVGTLYLEAAGNGYGTNNTPNFQVNGSLYAGVNGGFMGVGTTTADTNGTSGVGTKLNVQGGTAEINTFTTAGTEALDWPQAALSIRRFDDFTTMRMLQFGHKNDSTYQTGNSVWHLSLVDNTGSKTTSDSNTALLIGGPGALTFAPNGNSLSNDNVGVEIRNPGYVDGQYANRFVSKDEGGGIPLYVQGNLAGDGTTWTSLARFGTFTGNSNYFETFGATKIGGALTLTATTTSSNGFNITAGCYAMNGTCLGTNAPTETVLTSGSGATYTVPAGIKYIRVRMAGGGGGGGGGSSGTTGGTGGTTSFGSFTAVGGTGGTSFNNSTGGVGGTGGTGTATLRIPGGYGGAAGNGSQSTQGYGGNTPYFGGGGSSVSNNISVNGYPGTANTGGGGSGGGVASGAANGGAGGGSGEYVEILITSPAASYTYTIGGGGAGGVGAASTGGAGGTGVIVIEEYYTIGNDYAENYPTADPTLSAGELVALDSSPQNPGAVVRAAGTSTPVGVVSTQPGQLLGVADAFHQVPLALAGRVPVKVNYENGDINVGDRIALSSVPGVGRKANPGEASVGVATEGHMQGVSVGDTVVVFVDSQQGTYISSTDSATTTASALVASSTAATSTSMFAGVASAFSSTLRERIAGLGVMVVKVFDSAIAASVGVFDKVFAKEIFVDTVHAQELCLGATCVTEDELKELLQTVHQGSTQPGAGDTDGGTATSTPSSVGPVVTIVGNNPAHVPVGSSYADLGATVTSEVSPNIGYVIEVDGAAADTVSIDTSVAGEHTVVYTATDEEGQVGMATRTVIVDAPTEEAPAEEVPAEEQPSAGEESATSTDAQI